MVCLAVLDIAEAYEEGTGQWGEGCLLYWFHVRKQEAQGGKGASLGEQKGWEGSVWAALDKAGGTSCRGLEREGYMYLCLYICICINNVCTVHEYLSTGLLC